MKTPPSDQGCEICKIKTPKILIDGRVKQGPHGHKGHWVYMCSSCQEEWGIGCDPDNYIEYHRFGGRYFEVNKGENNVSQNENRV